MVYKDKEKERKYRRKWREKNREKCRKWDREYMRKNRDKFNKRKRDYYKRNRDNIRTKARIRERERYRKQRISVIDYYSKGTRSCNCCGEKEIKFLVLDHINGNGNKHRKEIGSKNIYSWIQKNNYPKGFQILCANCNQGRKQTGICPHKIKS